MCGREQFPGGQHAAAEQIEREIEDVDQRRERDPQRFAHHAPDGARLLALLAAPGGHFAHVPGRQVLTQVQHTRHGLDGGRGSMLFQAALVAAAARVAVGNHRDVPDFTGHAHEPAQHPAARNDAAADAGAEGQQDEVFHVAPGADPFLAQRGGVGVVLQNYGRAEAAEISSRTGKFSR